MKASFFSMTEAKYAAGGNIKHTIFDNVETAQARCKSACWPCQALVFLVPAACGNAFATSNSAARRAVRTCVFRPVYVEACSRLAAADMCTRWRACPSVHAQPAYAVAHTPRFCRLRVTRAPRTRADQGQAAHRQRRRRQDPEV
jgi:hypothetical protein